MSDRRWERHIARMARVMPYPQTPDIAGAVMGRLAATRPGRRTGRRLAWAAAAIVAAVGIIMATVPEARAGLAEFLQIGGIRILLVEPTAAPTSSGAVLPVTTTPTVGPMSFTLDDLSGETTLEGAEVALGADIPLPTYPPTLGAPDRVFVQDVGGLLAVLAWTDPSDPSRPRLMLTVLAPGTLGTKGPPTVIQSTTVDGQEALWTEGPYLLSYGGLHQSERLVQGPVLIWWADGFTYRLEGAESLDEAVMIAESLAFRRE
jgi:hypothetical protein